MGPIFNHGAMIPNKEHETIIYFKLKYYNNGTLLILVQSEFRSKILSKLSSEGYQKKAPEPSCEKEGLDRNFPNRSEIAQRKVGHLSVSFSVQGFGKTEVLKNFFRMQSCTSNLVRFFINNFIGYGVSKKVGSG